MLITGENQHSQGPDLLKTKTRQAIDV